MYNSPITEVLSDMTEAIRIEYENGIIRAVRNVGFDVNKAELEKALAYDRGQYEKGYADAMASRPQGEWIRTGRTNIYGGIEVQCSNCGDKVMVQHLEDEWYCRHCGADMGMKGVDDERHDI